jgi:hypothetical protein
LTSEFHGSRLGYRRNKVQGVTTAAAERRASAYC